MFSCMFGLLLCVLLCCFMKVYVIVDKCLLLFDVLWVFESLFDVQWVYVIVLNVWIVLVEVVLSLFDDLMSVIVFVMSLVLGGVGVKVVLISWGSGEFLVEM